MSFDNSPKPLILEKRPLRISDVTVSPLASKTSFAVVNFQVEGFHYWKDATPQRAYLAEKHRHLFHYTVAVEVRHNDREIEYHDLKDYCQKTVPSGDLGGSSCEDLADFLLQALINAYGEDRKYQIDVFEDGECGASVNWQLL